MCNHIPDGCCSFCLSQIEADRDRLADVLHRTYRKMKVLLSGRNLTVFPNLVRLGLEQVLDDLERETTHTVPGLIAETESDKPPV